MAMKGCSAFPKAPASDCLVSYPELIGGWYSTAPADRAMYKQIKINQPYHRKRILYIYTHTQMLMVQALLSLEILHESTCISHSTDK